MVTKRLRSLYAKEAKEFLNHVIEEKPLLPFLIPLVFFAWFIERWLVPFSNWVPLAFAVWATIQHGKFQRQILVENLNGRWKQLILNTSPITPIEPCEWLNKLLLEVWPNFLEPKLSRRFSSIVERRMKLRKPKLIEKIELQEFSLGSCPPYVGRNGIRWITSGEQKVMQLSFDWDTNGMSIILMAKLAKPLIGTARILINQIHIKGDLQLIPILDGQAILYSFQSSPEIRIAVAFGSGESQSLQSTELPGVSTWIVKLFTETLTKTMVEPRRACYPLPSINLRKTAVGGVVSVTVISAGKFSHLSNSKNLETSIEAELGDLTRKTKFSQGSSPTWDTTFNMVLHGHAGIIKFHLYERDPSSVNLSYLTSCEIKMRYVPDDSTMFWAIGHKSGVVAKQAELCGKEIEMVIPFEETNYGELTVRLVLKEWQFSDGSISLNKQQNSVRNQFQPPLYGSSSVQSRTGRKLMVTIVEGRNLLTSKSGKCNPYVKLQYGKVVHRTKIVSHTSNPVWNQMFELEEIGGDEYLNIKCYNSDKFGDENIGGAHVNTEGIQDGDCRDVWVPLEKVNSGELKLQIEAVKSDDYEGYKNSAIRSGTIELVIIEARDLIAADIRGTSDPYVMVQYGNAKKRTKVVHKTLNPQWNQTLEFPETGDRLILHVNDHNALLPAYSIGECVVEYEGLSPNQTVEKWIPLQGVKNGEIHVQVTRRVPEPQKILKADHDFSLSNARKISGQIRGILNQFQNLVEDGDKEGLLSALSEIESMEVAQEEYMLQLENEQKLLIDKISELGNEMSRTSSTPSNVPY